MEADNKYDQSFRNSELGKSIKEEMDDNSDEIAEAHGTHCFTPPEPADFGGGGGWI